MNHVSDDYNYRDASTNIEDMKVEFLFSRTREKRKEYDCIPHLHADTEVFLVLDGTFMLISDDGAYTLEKNSVCLVPRGCIHDIEASGEQGHLFSFLIKITPGDREAKIGSESAYYENVYSSFDNVLVLDNCEQIITYMTTFLEMAYDDNRGSVNIGNCLLQLVFLSLANVISDKMNIKFEENEKSSLWRGVKFEDYVLENYIMDNYQNNITIYDVASYVGYSATYTARRIKKNYGITYSKLIMRLKTSYARRMLIQTDKPLFEIALEVGYNSYNGFGLAFKKFYGKTPEQMRNEVV